MKKIYILLTLFLLISCNRPTTDNIVFIENENIITITDLPIIELNETIDESNTTEIIIGNQTFNIINGTFEVNNIIKNDNNIIVERRFKGAI